MTKEEFIKVLSEEGYSYIEQDGKLLVFVTGFRRENVYLDNITDLPEDIVFVNDGDVWMGSLTSLPPGIGFKNKGQVCLGVLTSIPSGTEFANKGGHINLKSIKSISTGAIFNTEEPIFLKSLTGGWFENWEGNIEDINTNELLRRMISLGIFDKG